ncbi:MAG: type I 3-dehydroquinate dehydratase [Candidatus Taylorbacteria bacterium]
MKSHVAHLLSQKNTIVGVIACHADLVYAQTSFPSADMYEWRVDCYHGIDVAKQIKTLHRPIILTVRDPGEGGQNKELTLAMRAKLYELYLPYASLVDIEAAYAQDLSKIIQLAKKRFNAGLIISCHRFDTRVLMIKLDRAAAIAREHQADVLKLAVTADTLEVFQKFLTYYARIKRQNEIPVAAMAMGKFGPVSRLLFGMDGTQLIYGYLAKPAVKGQLQVTEVRELLGKFNV